MNLSNFSDADLAALKSGQLGMVSTEGLRLLKQNYMDRMGETEFRKGLNPTIGMSTGDRISAAAGGVVADYALGAKQRFGKATTQDVEDKRATDAPLLATTAGKAGNFLGHAGMAVPLMLAPGANTYAGAGLYGSLLGALKPTGPNESVLNNALGEGALNMGGLAIGRGLFGGLAGNSNTPARQHLVDRAVDEYGIPLPASVRTGNKPLGYLESAVAGMPGGGRMADAVQNANQTFTSRVMEQAGAPAGAQATVAEAQGARNAVQDGYRQLWSRNAVNLDGQFVQDLNAAQAAAHRMLTPQRYAVVQQQIQNILSKEANGQIAGNVYQMGLRPELRNVAQGDTALTEPLRMVQRALDGAANRSLSGADAQVLADLNRQYAVGSALRTSIPRAEARGGLFSPSEVLSNLGGFQGAPGELGRISGTLRELPNSGTAQRALMQQLVTGGLLTGAGGGIGYATGGPEGAAVGATAGLLGPLGIAQILGSRVGQAALSRGVVPVAGAAQNLLANGLIRPLVTGAPSFSDLAQ